MIQSQRKARGPAHRQNLGSPGQVVIQMVAAKKGGGANAVAVRRSDGVWEVRLDDFSDVVNRLTVSPITNAILINGWGDLVVGPDFPDHPYRSTTGGRSFISISFAMDDEFWFYNFDGELHAVRHVLNVDEDVIGFDLLRSLDDGSSWTAIHTYSYDPGIVLGPDEELSPELFLPDSAGNNSTPVVVGDLIIPYTTFTQHFFPAPSFSTEVQTTVEVWTNATVAIIETTTHSSNPIGSGVGSTRTREDFDTPVVARLPSGRLVCIYWYEKEVTTRIATGPDPANFTHEFDVILKSAISNDEGVTWLPSGNLISSNGFDGSEAHGWSTFHGLPTTMFVMGDTLIAFSQVQANTTSGGRAGAFGFRSDDGGNSWIAFQPPEEGLNTAVWSGFVSIETDELWITNGNYIEESPEIQKLFSYNIETDTWKEDRGFLRDPNPTTPGDNLPLDLIAEFAGEGLIGRPKIQHLR